MQPILRRPATLTHSHSGEAVTTGQGSGMDGMEKIQERAMQAASHLPGIEAGTSYGTPAIKVRGKMLCRVKDGETLVLMCPLPEKELLMDAAPHIYFETNHYKGWPAVLVRMDAISGDELAHRIEQAWRMKAPKTVVKRFDEDARS